MRLLGFLLAGALALAGESGITAGGLASKSSAHSERDATPLFFVEDSARRFLIRGSGMTVVFTPQGVEFCAAGASIRATFQGANGATEVHGAGPMGSANFLAGQDPRLWRTGLPTHKRIRYDDLYKGIDLEYSGSGGRIKSEYTVHPGAPPTDIRVAYSTDLTIDSSGRLHAGELVEAAPEIYQDTARGRVQIGGGYRLLDPRTAGFAVASYDPSLPLTIDPVLSYSTYMGGAGLGAVTGVALDSAGNLYAAGWTQALDFPIVLSEQSNNAGSVDAFVVKLNPQGNTLLYATYIGGRGDDRAAAIAVDGSGQAYVTGSTASLNFPLVSAVNQTRGGAKTAFVLKLNAAGNALLYSTYLGGTTYDMGTAIAVGSAGSIYIAGDTQSANFPVIGGVQATIGGGFDAFVTKLSASGAYVFSTFLGGSADEHVGGIAVDTNGNVFVVGGTFSTNFPIAGAIQAASHGGQDAFVAKLNAAGTALSYSTYLGGSAAGTPEQANAIAIDSAGAAYVAGVTNSADFPVTSGAFQVLFNGVSDAFVTKINAAGSALIYSTYLGGTSFDWATGVQIDSSGNAYVAGYTSSEDFAQSSAVQAVFGGLYDAFVSKLSPAGNAVNFSTWFGGSGSDVANALAVDTSGNIFLGGQTSSLNLPLASPIQSSNNGGSVGWLARIGGTALPPQAPSVVSVTPSSGSGSTVVFAAQYADSGGATALTVVSLLVNASASTSLACYVSYDRATNVLSIANDNPASGSQMVTWGGGSQQNSQCAVNGQRSSVTLAGNTLTLNLSLTFKSGFAGAKSVYLYAADAGANTGWVSRGTYEVTAAPIYSGIFRSGFWLEDIDGNRQFDANDKYAWLGQSGDIPVVGDFDGDGVVEIGIFRNGFWAIDINHNGMWDASDLYVWLGQAGDIPVVGDFDGDGRADMGVFRSGFWAIDINHNGMWDVTDKYVWLGQAGDVPVVGDFNGDGIAEMRVFRSGFWAIDMNRNGVWDASDKYVWLGQAGDVPVVGDFNGDGVAEMGVFRSGFWAIDMNRNGVWDASDGYYWLGQAGDIPVVLR